MSNTSQKPIQELLHTLNNADEDQNKQNSGEEELRKFHEIEDTPFHALEENEGFKMIFGDYMISENKYETLEELKEMELNKYMWHTISKLNFAINDYKDRFLKDK